MQNRKALSLPAGFIAVLLLSQACAIDPWRDESFQDVRGLRDSDGIHFAENDDLVMFISSSGFENEARSPYAVSMRLRNNGIAVDTAIIKGFKVVLNGEEIRGISLHNIRSGNTVELESDSIDINPAPCCIFWIASNSFEVAHVEGELLTVTVDWCVTTAGDLECISIKRSFRATVRKGLIQVIPV
jgi:hypothetical protein